MKPVKVQIRNMSTNQETCRLAFPDIENPPYTRITYGLDFATACSKHLDDWSSTRAYVIASGGLVRSSDSKQRLEQALGHKLAGFSVGGIKPHTPWDDLVPIINDMRQKQADCLVTLGGGSLADGAKIIVYALANGVKSLEDLEELARTYPASRALEDPNADLGKAPTVPIICVLTTLSAAEYSRYGAGTDSKTHLKSIMTHPGMCPSLLVLDPALCLTTPDWIWRSTGVRAIDHCVEGFCSSNSQPESDIACERGLKRLIRALLAYAKDEKNLDAHLEAQLGANDAMYGLTLRVWCGASHGIGHQLGPLGVGHGETSCILLPAVMKYNAKVNQKRQDVIKRILWDEDDIADVLQEHGLKRDSSDVGDALRAVFNELKMPSSLKQVGVGRDKFEVIARNSLEDHMCQTNPIPLTKEALVMEILEMVSGN